MSTRGMSRFECIEFLIPFARTVLDHRVSDLESMAEAGAFVVDDVVDACRRVVRAMVSLRSDAVIRSQG